MFNDRILRVVYIESALSERKIYDTFAACGKIQAIHASDSYFLEFAYEFSMRQALSMNVPGTTVAAVASSPALITRFNDILPPARSTLPLFFPSPSPGPSPVPSTSSSAQPAPTTREPGRSAQPREPLVLPERPSYDQKIGKRVTAKRQASRLTQVHTGPSSSISSAYSQSEAQSTQSSGVLRPSRTAAEHGNAERRIPVSQMNATPVAASTAVFPFPAGQLSTAYSHLHSISPSASPLVPASSSVPSTGYNTTGSFAPQTYGPTRRQNADAMDIDGDKENLTISEIPNPLLRTGKDIMAISYPSPSSTLSAPLSRGNNTPSLGNQSTNCSTTLSTTTVPQPAVPPTPSPYITLIFRGSQVNVDLSTLEDDPTGIITVLHTTAASALERDKWMIVAATYRGSGRLQAALAACATPLPASQSEKEGRHSLANTTNLPPHAPIPVSIPIPHTGADKAGGVQEVVGLVELRSAKRRLEEELRTERVVRQRLEGELSDCEAARVRAEAEKTKAEKGKELAEAARAEADGRAREAQEGERRARGEVAVNGDGDAGRSLWRGAFGARRSDLANMHGGVDAEFHIRCGEASAAFLRLRTACVVTMASILLLAGMSTSYPSLWSFRDHKCTIWGITVEVMTVLLFLISAVFAAIRVYAVSGKGYIPTGITLVFGIIPIIPEFRLFSPAFVS
ncbi:hypothetical protein POSPLADRAFT_1131997 [Postia placenta MAD-698-R-SB12]|uniref:Uncharacterized protein n=1 Tax=Postia placenta MAD-698-R-SB12 TaxID=670580 RepID=A0A1X6NDI9_9APHY|nr:hypothetical protein POSPLADRAFT_1131997 [Postia placenta MAD-698-R-SB12]OSX66705.1 hypothetical protein POSPLADRAFT_1131997 [Postia placenta MAD-698-R-SB12]